MKATYILPCLLSLNALFKVLYPAVQHIVSVGVGHASKSVCSGVFLSNRTAQSVEENGMVYCICHYVLKCCVHPTLLSLPQS